MNWDMLNRFTARIGKSKNEYMKIIDDINVERKNTNMLLADAIEIIEDAKEEIIRLRLENKALREHVREHIGGMI